MARLRERDLGASRGICACCHREAELRLRDSRFTRTFGDLLDRHFDQHVQRTATCGGCGSTYPVRATDRTPDRAATRSDSPRASRSTGRDWRDTSVRV
jgi:hypothetical protein